MYQCKQVAPHVLWLSLGTGLLASLALSGCGSSDSSATAPPPAKQTVTGVAMPSSVSVVTATNAG